MSWSLTTIVKIINIPCNSACALASFIVMVVDVEEKGYDGVLVLAGWI